MQKLKDFLYMFCWMMTFETIGRDLGILTPEKNVWGKYFVPIGVGLMWAFYFADLQRKRKAAFAGKPIDENT